MRPRRNCSGPVPRGLAGCGRSFPGVCEGSQCGQEGIDALLQHPAGIPAPGSGRRTDFDLRPAVRRFQGGNAGPCPIPVSPCVHQQQSHPNPKPVGGNLLRQRGGYCFPDVSDAESSSPVRPRILCRACRVCRLAGKECRPGWWGRGRKINAYQVIGL